MQSCPQCGFENRDEATICERCGAALVGTASVGDAEGDGQERPARKQIITRLLSYLSRVETRSLDDEETQFIEPIDLGPYEDTRSEDAGAFPAGANLILRIVDYEIVIEDPRHDIWLGRFGEKMPPPRDAYIVDLTDFAGYRMGVSRLHANIKPTADGRLELIDQASSNGTSLNGHRLEPFEPYYLYDGDEIVLGHMPIEIRFQKS